MTHRDFMEYALALAKKAADIGEVPVGAVIVKNGKIIGEGYNLRQTKNNSLLHAEIIAINEACENTDSWRLNDCTLYVTLEPCLMCSGAIINSRIKTVVYGCVDEKAGGLGGMTNLLSLPVNHKPEILIGIRELECQKILEDFFENLRKKIN